MWSRLLRAALLLAAAGIVATPAWRVWQRTSGYEWYAAMIVTVAEAELGIGYQRTSRQEVRQPDGRTVVLALPEIASWPQALAMREKLKRQVFAGATVGELRRRIRPLQRRALDRVLGSSRPPPYRIAGVQYPERAVTQHTIVSGTTGSGKTVLISVNAKRKCPLFSKAEMSPLAGGCFS